MIEKIDIHLVDHCNLNCKGCTHFSPLAQEFYLDLDTYECDLTRLSKLTKGEVGSIFLLGGEPLLHPHVTEFFPIARRLFPDTKLVMITNAVLLPKQDDSFWQACRDNKIQIWVSKYDLTLDYATVENTAKSYGVFLGYTSTRRTEDGAKEWIKYTLDPEGTQYYVNSSDWCAVKNCATLKKGKLYTCCTVAHIEHFNKYFNKNLEVTPYDYVDIYKVHSMRALEAALSKPIPFCRYCKTGNHEMGVWAPSKKEISEWI